MTTSEEPRGFAREYPTPEAWQEYLDKNYFDLFKVIEPDEGQGSYHDFEGFADPDHTEAILQHPDVQARLDLMARLNSTGEPDKKKRDVLRTLLAHFSYENEDQGDYQINPQEACVFLDTVEWLLSCRYWLSVDAPAEDVKPAE